MNKIQIIIAFSLLVFFSCREQIIPIPDPVIPTEGRVLLVEEFTGVDCVNCVPAAAQLKARVDETDGAIVVYAVHGLNQPGPIDGTTYDFKNADAIELEKDFEVTAKPAAAFNRITFQNGLKIKAGSRTWDAIIDEELKKPLVAEIFLTADYEGETRRIDINTAVVSLEEITGDIFIHVVISESHLIDSQNAPGAIDFEYEHNHVMKASCTGLKGQRISAGMSENERQDAMFSYTIPEELDGEWIADNIEITAFVTAKDRDDEVLQAKQIHLIE